MLYVWHADRKIGILIWKLRNLADALILTEGHSIPIWRKGCQGIYLWVELLFKIENLNLLKYLAKYSAILDIYVICLKKEVLT